MSRVPAVLAVVVALLAGSSVAGAAPLLEPHVGGIGFTGPTSPDASAVFWNPAALGGLTGTQVLIGGSARLDLFGIERATISSADGMPDPAGDRSFEPLDLTALTPGWFAGMGTDLGTEDWRLGLALYTPFAERFPSSPELAYHVDGGQVYASFLTLAAAVRASSDISLGLGLSLAWPTLIDIRFSRDKALESCLAVPCGVEDPAQAEELRFHSSLFDWPGATYAFNAGLLFRVPKVNRLLVGISYMTATTLYPRGDIRRELDVEASGQSPTPYELSGNGRITFALPQMLHLGARYDLDDVALLATLHYVGYSWTNPQSFDFWDLRAAGSELQAQAVPERIVRYRNFRDVLSFDAGAEWQATRRLRMAGIFRVESSAVPEAQVAADQIDAPKVELGAGAALRLSTAVTLEFGYSFTAYLPRQVTDSVFSPQAYLDCRASGTDLDACTAVAEGRAIPTAAGDYERFTHEATTAVSFHWW